MVLMTREVLADQGAKAVMAVQESMVVLAVRDATVEQAVQGSTGWSSGAGAYVKDWCGSSDDGKCSECAVTGLVTVTPKSICSHVVPRDYAESSEKRRRKRGGIQGERREMGF
ncbi:hypothetical protein DPX16_14205 [Anabarilius grahami]|uniref:Uncharacterized protein n=1 Tax=Anabarilius grahami TaxID=495550 RepID=A0A3N0XF74_ANAGA|nr:hypothetical protein DPX16_14205 [Anabarilius grahami]